MHLQPVKSIMLTACSKQFDMMIRLWMNWWQGSDMLEIGTVTVMFWQSNIGLTLSVMKLIKTVLGLHSEPINMQWHDKTTTWLWTSWWEMTKWYAWLGMVECDVCTTSWQWYLQQKIWQADYKFHGSSRLDMLIDEASWADGWSKVYECSRLMTIRDWHQAYNLSLAFDDMTEISCVWWLDSEQLWWWCLSSIRTD